MMSYGRARPAQQPTENRRMQTVALEQSVAMIPDGASLMIGGFMAVGTPERVIDEMVRQNRRDLTVIANDTATPGRGIGKLIAVHDFCSLSRRNVEPPYYLITRSSRFAEDINPWTQRDRLPKLTGAVPGERRGYAASRRSSRGRRATHALCGRRGLRGNFGFGLERERRRNGEDSLDFSGVLSFGVSVRRRQRFDRFRAPGRAAGEDARARRCTHRPQSRSAITR